MFAHKKGSTLIASAIVVLSLSSLMSPAAYAEPKGLTMVRIPGKNFEIGKYEVTQGEWKAMMGKNPSHFERCGDNCPVEQVSWNEVQLYLQKLNAKTGKKYRLPTETEWEYACFGDTKKDYCVENLTIDNSAWLNANSDNTPHPIGQKKANNYGLHDMNGNVWEWMQDCDENNCDVRVSRGGSWSNMPQSGRTAFRIKNTPEFKSKELGFRLARTL
jgi:formylglycine-generating enzyme required for sulfatase activity